MLVVINSINAKVNLKHSANSVINKDSTNIQDRKKIEGLGINGVFKNFDSIAKSSKRSDHDQTTNEIVMKLKTGYDISDVKEILNRHKSFYFLRQMKFGKKVFYVLKINKDERDTDIDVDSLNDDADVTALKKDKKVKNIKVQRKFHFVTSSVNPSEISDPKFWNINGDVLPSINVQAAWDLGITGAGVKVAIVDQYLDLDHEDMKDNLITDLHYDYVDNDNNPRPESQSAAHGTAVAGIILSKPGNNVCTVGIAYNATGVGVAVIDSTGSLSATDVELARYLSHEMEEIDIYSNSWGPGQAYGYLQVSEVLEEAFINGVTNGRNGKGNIYVFAAGNYRDNTNSNGLLTSPYTIAVSAVSNGGMSASFRSVGSSIMTVAYGEGQGSTNGIVVPIPYSNCIDGAEGTSFSCPTVSGAIALCLEINPNLTWRSIQHLLVQTSKKHNLADSDSNYQWQENGAKFQTHPTMGFGLLDVGDMVQKAENFPVLQALETCTINRQKRIRTKRGGSKSDNLNVLCSGQGTNCGTIRYLESVLVTISFRFTANRGSVEFYLYSPFGTKSYLMTHRPEDSSYHPMGGSLVWTYKTLQTWGENPCSDASNGDRPWRLEFRTIDKAVRVTLNEWSLTLYGTETSPHINQRDLINKIRGTQKILSLFDDGMI
ncbi:PCSK2 [Mytilus edulis]|uniref:PCSK2 n=1 Tax=Mytilus edulis TaxID=6550 RepID=A0A8S3RKF6_MYTED|nr:PCSK2 [Mytilus edulis]